MGQKYIGIPRDDGRIVIVRDTNSPLRSPGDKPYTEKEGLLNELYHKIWGDKGSTVK